MALSGAYNFTLTAEQLIAAAYRKIGVASANTKQNTNALQALEILLKSLQSEGFNLTFPWTQEWITQVLTQSTVSYTLNAKVVGLDQLFIRRSSNDTPVTVIGKENYFAINTKTTEGLPNQVWMDKQYAAPVFYLYPVPENSTDVLHILVINKFQDIDSVGNNIDINATWFRALTYALASDLSFEEKVDRADRGSLITYSSILMEKAKQGSGDLGSVFISLRRT